MITVARIVNENRAEFSDSLAGLQLREGETVWIDVQQPTWEMLRQVDDIVDLNDATLEDCLTGEQRPRIDDYESYFFVVIYGMRAAGSAEVRPRKLSFFWGDSFLITIHEEPLESIARLQAHLKSGHMRVQLSSDYLFFEVVDRIVDNYLSVVGDYELEVEKLEDESLVIGAHESLLERCSTLRNDITQMRQLAMAMIELVSPFANGRYDDVTPKLSKQFLHVRDHLSTVLESTDRLREMINIVRENYRATLAHRTNEIMRMLTIYAGILLPLSLIAGIYGMNLPLWPDPERPANFWAVLGFMGVFAIATYAFFRTRKWL